MYYPIILIASMHASPSKPFNLDFTLLSHKHHLDDLRQRVFRVSSWLLQVTHHVRLGRVPQHTHPSSSNCLGSRRSPLFGERLGETHILTYVWEGQLWSTYLVREMTVLAIVLFSACCIPPFAALLLLLLLLLLMRILLPYHIFFFLLSFSYPYTPHSFRSWIGSIHREARLGYGYRKDRVFRDENGYHVCEACAPLDMCF